MPATNPEEEHHPWLRIVARLLLLLIFLLVAAGFLYENISEARDRRFHPMPGRLVDVGGYKMLIDCTGEGSPTVVLDSGLGDSFISWRKVQPQIAKITRVCSYDRAGLGYSDNSPNPRTSEVMARELHTLLRNAGVSTPIILVGHSMGGFNVRLYAKLYRNEVTGMVLVDSSHPEQQKRFPPAVNDLDAGWVREEEFMEFATPFGIPRLLGFCGKDAAVRASECNFHTVREGVAELKSISTSAAQTADAGLLGDLPLVVLSHDPEAPLPDFPEDLVKPVNDTWRQMQKELAGLSTHGTQRIAKNSGHYIQLDRPELVIDAVREVAEQSRQAPDRP